MFKIGKKKSFSSSSADIQTTFIAPPAVEKYLLCYQRKKEIFHTAEL